MNSYRAQLSSCIQLHRENTFLPHAETVTRFLSTEQGNRIYVRGRGVCGELAKVTLFRWFYNQNHAFYYKNTTIITSCT